MAKQNKTIRVIYRDTQDNVLDMQRFAKDNNISVSQLIRFSLDYVMSSDNLLKYLKDGK